MKGFIGCISQLSSILYDTRIVNMFHGVFPDEGIYLELLIQGIFPK